MNGYYSVFNPNREKIADCGAERDALFLIHSRNAKWDGHYYQYNPLPGEIIDTNGVRQLPTTDIVVNMDGGVGGSWSVVDEPPYAIVGGQKLYLQQSNLQRLD